MLWILAAVVVIVVVALAWWSSGRNHTPLRAGASEADRRSQSGTAEHTIQKSWPPPP
jgi:hypothetical protein